MSVQSRLDGKLQAMSGDNQLSQVSRAAGQTWRQQTTGSDPRVAGQVSGHRVSWARFPRSVAGRRGRLLPPGS
jgi:hypothetical protein